MADRASSTAGSSGRYDSHWHQTHWRNWFTLLSAIALTTTATAPSLLSVVNCYRGCNQSRMQLHVWSLQPGDPIAWRQRIIFKTAVLVYKCLHGMVPPCQRHHTAVNSLFHVWRQTAVNSVCSTFHCQCSGNDWKCSCCTITVIRQQLTLRICCTCEVCAL